MADERKKVIEIYDKFKEANLPQSILIQNMHLDASIRLKDSNRVVESLNKIAEMKLQPKRHYIKILGQTKDLPDRVFIALRKFNRFAYVARPRYRFTSDSFRPRKEKLGKLLKNNNKRHRLKKGIKRHDRFRGFPFTQI